MRRHLAILRVCVASSLQTEMEYRTSFVVNFVNSLLSLGASLLILYALFAQGRPLAGWSFTEVLVVLGTFTIADSMVDMLLRPSLGKVSEYVRQGSLDYLLLKPVNLQYLVSVRNWTFWGLPNLLLGIGLVLYGMSANGALGVANLALFAVMAMAGIAVIYALWATLAVLAFWFVQASQAQFLLYAALDAGRFPVGVYPVWLRLIFTFVAPIAFVTTVPAAAAVGRLDWGLALGGLVAAPVALAVSVLVWRLAIRSYTSASS
ncbi:MAG TPA: ABC-2 family transporter protein [Hypericibacter adhaerens]|jgi:ABC-2 type transport system permease protein|uniref:ABC transporter permease n=1 Tax=Hypericibacter adhaerens TaxID=2602016 RepID=A0A5J6MZU0_9PROT|nr:ABC-2 family transporter protein [Hypericibacter adhaerens]QEX21830.1 ABC transporter permease [Hypericibacter adhaerens]HWA46164.1 ABC-2 family transporter protein [Hypericibacter adhaerens]